jgi:hypothetical protein
MKNPMKISVAHRIVCFLEKRFWAPALIMVLVFMLLLPFAITRYVDVDEGYYLYAAELILQGKTPYADFFYPQMPLFPYIYAGWMGLWGVEWLSAHISTLLQCASIAALLLITGNMEKLPFLSDFRQKAETALGTAGHTSTKGGIGAQFLLLTVVMLGSLTRWRSLTISEWSVIIFGSIAAGIALLPTPTLHSYIYSLPNGVNGK